MPLTRIMTTVPTRRRGPIRSSAAFTLIELLVVVSIISILASIAVPNFLEAQTRAKVARVKNDQRVLAGALEMYYVDWATVPDRSVNDSYRASDCGMVSPTGAWAPPKPDTRIEEMSVLTTPISYLTQLPADVFEPYISPPNNVIDYWDPVIIDWIPKGNCEWALVSVGPDGHIGHAGKNNGYPPIDSKDYRANTFRVQYDPTHGTISAGNIYRFQKRPDPKIAFE